jgi:hypothetical protein
VCGFVELKTFELVIREDEGHGVLQKNEAFDERLDVQLPQNLFPAFNYKLRVFIRVVPANELLELVQIVLHELDKVDHISMFLLIWILLRWV